MHSRITAQSAFASIRSRIALFAGVLLMLAPTAWALMPSTPTPGGIAILTLPPDAQSASYEDYPIWLIHEDDRAVALVGLALDAKPGPHQLNWQDAEGHVRHLAFTVEDKHYPTQKLTVPPKMVDLDVATLERVRQEQSRIRAALTYYRPTSGDFPWPLAQPAAGPTSSPFGLRRLFNGKPRKPHSGLDIAAAEGTPIQTPAAGIVIDIGDFYFNGKTVFVDHGGGLVSMYCHLSSFAVQKGESLQPGQLLGQVGRTGRATGAHLHWGVALNGNLVDPALFLAAETAAQP